MSPVKPRRQLVIAADQNLVGNVGLGTLAVDLDAPQSDVILAEDTAAIDRTPTRGLDGRVHAFRSDFGIAHGCILYGCLKTTPSVR